MFRSSSSCLRVAWLDQLATVSFPLLASDEGHISTTQRTPSARSCSCSFEGLVVADVTFEEHEGSESVCCWEGLREELLWTG